MTVMMVVVLPRLSKGKDDDCDVGGGGIAGQGR